jgi:pimeloyl-ACP methyl ester carboxylesterase
MSDMATFVLVHGAWHGGWEWRKLERPLRAAGHGVFSPTLTGLGERAHLAHSGIGLVTHVQDIVSFLEYEDLTGVTLVGHSYGGNVISGVAERVPERLHHLVYLDGFVPRDGESLVDLLPPEVQREFEDRVQTEGEGWLIPSRFPEPWETALRDHYGVTDEADLRWMVPRMRPHPFKTMTDPIRLGNPAAGALPRTYIRCTQYPNAALSRFAEAARTPGSGWNSLELAAGHDAMVSVPDELADLLLGIARQVT